MARHGCGEGDTLGVQEVHQLGGTQTDPRRLELGLEGGQDQGLVLQDLSVELRVGQDEGAHRLEPVLEAGRRLGGRDAAVGVRVSVRGGGGGGELWVGPEQTTGKRLFFSSVKVFPAALIQGERREHSSGRFPSKKHEEIQKD